MKRCTIIVLIILMGVNLYAWNPFASEDNRPKWVQSSPRDNDYYINEVGIASIEEEGSESRAKDVAKKRAMGEIAMKIRVEVESWVVSEMREDAEGNIESSYEDKVKTYSEVNFESDELTEKDEYFDEKSGKVYVWLQLDKLAYEERVKEKIQKEKESILSVFSKAVSAEGDHNFSEALTNYLKAFARKKMFFGNNVLVMDIYNNDSPENIEDITAQKIRGILAYTNVRSFTDAGYFTREGVLKSPLRIGVYYDEEAMNQVPMDIQILDGNAEYDGNIVTGSGGIASIRLWNISTDKDRYIVNIKPDLFKMAGAGMMDEYVQSSISTFNAPSVSVDIFMNPTVGVTGYSTISGTGLSENIKNTAEQEIRNKNLEVFSMNKSSIRSVTDLTDDAKQGLKYLFVLKSYGSIIEDAGIYMAKAGLKFEVYEVETGVLIGEKSTGTFTEYGTSKSEAVSKALYEAKGKLKGIIRGFSFH